MKEQEEFYIKEEEMTNGLKLIRFYFGKMGRFFPFVTKRLFWYLFSKPRNRKWLDKHQEFVDKSISHNKVSIEYKRDFVVHQFGKSEKKILLCHGWEGRTTDFQLMINELLANNMEVWSVDFPGHGKSPKGKAHLPLFRDVIYTICGEIDFYGLVGHSLGAASLALSFKEMNIKKPKYFVFMGLHPIPKHFVTQFKQITNLDDNTFKKCITYGEKLFNTSITDLDCHLYLNKFKENHILFIQDVNDRVALKDRVEKFAEMIPNSKVLIGEHGGHYVHFKHPKVVGAVTHFMSV